MYSIDIVRAVDEVLEAGCRTADLAHGAPAMTTEEMTEAIERFRNWASKEVGIYLPAPHEHELLIQMAIETQRQSKFI